MAEASDRKRIMVASIGNSLIQDDGFGAEVIRKLRSAALPAGVEVEDFGIGSTRMAHRLMDGYDLLIIADIAKRGGKPGTLYLIELDNDKATHSELETENRLSGHVMGSDDLLSLIKTFNAWPKKVLLVCCEPLLHEEYGIGLSKPVQEAVDGAVELIRSIVAKELG